MRLASSLLLMQTALLSATTTATAFGFTVSGVLTHSRPIYVATSTGIAVADNASGKLGYGAMASFDFAVTKSFFLESGAVYFYRKFDDTALIPSLTRTATLTETTFLVPVILRYRLNHVISIGAGMYASTAIGDIQWKTASESGSLSRVSQNLLNLDYGMTGLIGLLFPDHGSRAYALDFRYRIGLFNTANTELYSRKWSEFELSFGLRFGDLPGN